MHNNHTLLVRFGSWGIGNRQEGDQAIGELTLAKARYPMLVMGGQGSP